LVIRRFQPSSSADGAKVLAVQPRFDALKVKLVHAGMQLPNLLSLLKFLL